MDQQTMKKVYELQQTHEGQEALRVKRELAQKFSMVMNRPFRVGTIQPLKNAKTGIVTQYFEAD